MEKKLNIEGMKCEGCVNRIKNALSTVKGLDTFTISLEKKELILNVKKESTIQKAIAKIEDLGFEINSWKRITILAVSNFV